MNAPPVMPACTCFPPIKLLVTTDLPGDCPSAGYILHRLSSHPVKISCGGHMAVNYSFFNSRVLWWGKKVTPGH